MQWWLRGERLVSSCFAFATTVRVSQISHSATIALLPEYNLLLITPCRPAWRSCITCFVLASDKDKINVLPCS